MEPFYPVGKPENFGRHGFANPVERLDYLQTVMDAAMDGTKWWIDDPYIVIQGPGQRLYLEFNAIGAITGFLDDTSGG